jgi:23S rRNA-/tRNA-specific pseudouridylate synthase
MFIRVHPWLNHPMNILHLDKHIIVLDKPADLPVLTDSWDKDAPYLVKKQMAKTKKAQA